ncbi:hypothetical protein DKM44_05340 [Deinococcus irradiatisoli]|uniref:N-acetyltransferase domain-containing protein n=1 Tax=Deinococcus irradiatisoli TaxID=2202254 RepID=A0A2Z3JFF2_9DEIO|nr:GNAT family N-acetyltransferase [Deinococcus irradiatisoli]AWN22726.1 hypothetical protein DKM44_05340 [Deinococcus irradiatisoli]
MSDPLRFETIDPTLAPDTTLRALIRHQAAVRAERMPTDPPLSEAALLAALRRPSGTEDCSSLIWDRQEVVASAELSLPLNQNVHVAFVEMTVSAPYRRQGLARRMMAQVADHAESRGRRLFMTTADSRLPAGEAVLRRIGAELVMEQQFLELDLTALAPDLLSRWTGEAQQQAPAYRVWQNLGAYPAERLADIAALHEVMNTAPSGTRNLEALKITAELLRQQDEALEARGRQRLSTFAEVRASGELAAYSELLWDTERPSLLFQHATAVRPEHRRHSLGRWIKAANLQAALKFNPQAHWVRAGNTPDNAGMRSINQALGFEPYTTHTDWQISVAALRTYLGAARR